MDPPLFQNFIGITTFSKSYNYTGSNKVNAIFNMNILTCSNISTSDNSVITGITISENQISFNWLTLMTDNVTLIFDDIISINNTISPLPIIINIPLVDIPTTPIWNTNQPINTNTQYHGSTIQMNKEIISIQNITTINMGTIISNVTTSNGNILFDCMTSENINELKFSLIEIEAYDGGRISQINIDVISIISINQTSLIYNGIQQQITVIFVNNLSILPQITQLSNNGTITNTTYINNQLIFNWTPSITGITTFTFTGIPYVTSITSQNINVLDKTIITSIIPTIYYNGIQQVITVQFTNILIEIPTIIAPSDNGNGIISNTSIEGNTLVFAWIPIGTGTTLTFQFNNVTGTPDILTSINLTVLQQTLLTSILPVVSTINVLTPMTATFNNNITTTPTIIPVNGTIENINIQGNTITYNWTPNITGTLTIQFANINGNNETITSPNITVYATNVLLTLIPMNNIYNGIPVTMTSTFSKSLSVLPTIVLPNGVINGSTITGNGTQVTFSWTPNAMGTVNFQFNNVTGSVETLISNNVIVIPQTTLLSLTPIITTINTITLMSATFTNNIITNPTVTEQGTINGTINNISYIENTITYYWTPVNVGNMIFQLVIYQEIQQYYYHRVLLFMQQQ